MRFEVLDGETVTNTVEAELPFMLIHFPLGNYRVVDEPTPLAPAPEPARSRTITQYRFRARFTMAEKVALYTMAKSTPLLQAILDDLAACHETGSVRISVCEAR